MRTNDRLRTGPAVSWLIPRIALVIVVTAGAAVLCRPLPWFIAAVAFAVIGAALPSSFGAFGAVPCIVVGMLLTGPDAGHAMLAVLTVHLIQVLSSLLLVIPPRTVVLLAALVPTARRVVLVQAIAQPLTVLVLLATAFAGIEEPWVAVAGGAALAGLAVLLVRDRTVAEG